MLAIPRLAVGHLGAHDHFSTAVKGTDFKAGFGPHRLVVVDHRIKAAAHGTKHVHRHIHEDFSLRVGGHCGHHTVKQQVIAYQAHQQARIALGYADVLVAADALIGKAVGLLLALAFGLGGGGGWAWA